MKSSIDYPPCCKKTRICCNFVKFFHWNEFKMSEALFWRVKTNKIVFAIRLLLPRRGTWCATLNSISTEWRSHWVGVANAFVDKSTKSLRSITCWLNFQLFNNLLDFYQSSSVQNLFVSTIEALCTLAELMKINKSNALAREYLTVATHSASAFLETTFQWTNYIHTNESWRETWRHPSFYIIFGIIQTVSSTEMLLTGVN